MLLRALQAVLTATSYLSSIVPRSPSLPHSPGNLPAFFSLNNPSRTLPLREKKSEKGEAKYGCLPMCVSVRMYGVLRQGSLNVHEDTIQTKISQLPDFWDNIKDI